MHKGGVGFRITFPIGAKTMAQPTLGIDLAKDKFDVALFHNDRFAYQVVPNTASGITALLSWLQAQGCPQVHACLEATGTYGDAVAHALHAAGHVVSIVNPAVLKAFRQSTLTRTKNDRTDAHLLARYAALHHPAAWTPPTPELQELQALARRLESLHQLRQQESNRLEGADRSSLVVESIQIMLTALDQEIARVEQLLKDHIQQHPDLKAQHELLRSIPGIGDKTATTLLAECGNLAGFTDARALAAYAGLTPKQHQSGTSVHGKPRLSKMGSERLRKALYFPALTALRYNPIIKAFGDQLLSRGKPKMLVLGAAMRKLLHLAYGVLKSGKPFDPDYGHPKPIVA
jgi:transposase